MSRKATMTAGLIAFVLCCVCVSQVLYHRISTVVTLFLSPLGNGRGKRLIGIYTTGYPVFLSIKALLCWEGTSLVAQMVKRLSTMWETQVQSLGREDPLEKEMAILSSTIAWKMPWMEEPGRLQSMGSQRVRHDWATSLSLFTFMHWRRKWQPTPVFFPGESQGRGSLVGWRLWGCTESDTTEVT